MKMRFVLMLGLLVHVGAIQPMLAPTNWGPESVDSGYDGSDSDSDDDLLDSVIDTGLEQYVRVVIVGATTMLIFNSLNKSVGKLSFRRLGSRSLPVPKFGTEFGGKISLNQLGNEFVFLPDTTPGTINLQSFRATYENVKFTQDVALLKNHQSRLERLNQITSNHDWLKKSNVRCRQRGILKQPVNFSDSFHAPAIKGGLKGCGHKRSNPYANMLARWNKK